MISICGSYEWAHAKQSDDFVGRKTLVDQELECVMQKLSNGKKITWQDVCYTDTHKAGRARAIENALDRTERSRSKRLQRALPQEPAPVYDIEIPRMQHKYKRYKSIYADGDERSGSLEYKYERRTNRDLDKSFQATIQITAGQRVDDVDWNIAGDSNGMNPNILTEYTWPDLYIVQIKTKANVVLNNRIVLDGMVAYGEIYSGDNRVSEYDGDNRTTESSRTDNSGDEGETLDLSGGLGYRFYLGEKDDYFELDRFWVTPLVGYSYHEQNLNIKEGVQIIDTGGMLGLGPFPGLDSPYDLEWKGPWFGVELAGRKDRLSGTFRFEYHLTDYYGEGVLNLQPTFRKYEHDADGQGMVFNIGLGYQINDNWRLNFSADLQDWDTDSGIHTLFLTDGTTRTNRLNEVNWESYALMLGATLEL